VPVSSSVIPWSLTLPAGSLQQWTFTFTVISQTTGQQVPYPLTGVTGWEFVVRPVQTDLTVPPLISITTIPSLEGQLVITSTATLSTAQLTITPSATVSLNGEYWSSLWMNPNTTSAFSWVSGPFVVAATAQP
jgi:hypothetical protein